MNNLLKMKSNLIQNFYIIGLPIEEIINITSIDDKEKSLDIPIDLSKVYSPKIISKFPPIENNFNKILDEFVIDHTFPKGLKIKEGKKYGEYTYHFEFELDNKLYKFIDKNKSLYSKIHFTCLKFYESIKDYKKLNEYIYKYKLKENENENDNDKDDMKKINTNSSVKSNNLKSSFIMIEDGKMSIVSPTYFIPKVICFASLLPFPDELHKILINIYDFYKYQSIKSNRKDYVHCPIEKLIEQIIMSLPLPISNNNEIILLFNIEKDNFDIDKNIFKYPKIIFSSYDLRDYYLNKTYNLSMIEIFNHFTEENTIKIFKYIILENPILFFCDDKELLSNIIEGFLNILCPFRYVLPHITILPSKYYGLIHSQDKFIFGINEKYSENFFQNNEINLNKNIIIVSIVKTNMNSTKIEEISRKNDDKIKNIYINQEEPETNFPNNLNNIDLPLKFKRKLLTKLKDYLNYIRSNFKKNILEKTYVFNNKVRHIFHKFFINILSGYTKFLLKCPSHGFFGDNIRHKYNGKNGIIKYIKEIFDIDGFISNFPKETQMFYKAFFNTELFFNFIRGIIYPYNEIDSLRNKYFDFMTFLKKNKELRKEEDFQEQYERHKKPFEYKKNTIKKNIVISDKYYFTDEEKKMLINKNNRKTALIKYSQLIELNKDEEISNIKLSKIIFSIRYFLFPKLLFDNEFFNINYNIQFYHHFIELPNDIFIEELNKSINISESDYINKYCTTIYPCVANQKMSLTNFFFGQNNNNIYHSSSPNVLFDLYIHNYIEFNWLLLLSCSLWYCNSNKEKEVRINKIFNILEILDYIEEQVLYFIFFSLYKYSNIGQFIRIFEFLYRFIGSYSYSDLLLLFKKITDMKKNEKNNEKNFEIFNIDKDIKFIIQKRSFLDVKNYVSKEEIDDKLKEEIIFSTEQICKNCNKNIKLEISEISDIINRKIEKNKDNFVYKCKHCGELNNEIIINYIILLSNIKKNKEQKIAEGKFKLVMPHLLYRELKNYVVNLKDNNIDIDHIFSNKNINLMNYIFYFSLNCLPFDFLIPYQDNSDDKSDREYFIIDKFLNKEGNEDKRQNNINLRKKFTELSYLNHQNFCLSSKLLFNFDD